MLIDSLPDPHEAAPVGNQENAVNLRDAVLAIVAHDLRSPLATIEMAAELLEVTAVGGEQHAHLINVIHKAAAQIDKLVGDLIEITRLEGTQLPLNKSETHIRALLREAMVMFQPQADKSGVTLRLEMPARDCTVLLDRDRILQVLGNLISNALKFTPRSGVVALRCMSTPTELGISVQDTGIGIAPEQLEHLFERFWQAHYAHRAGAGLGLAISKAIVEAHGGRILVTSEVGRGSTFRIVLPRGEINQQTSVGNREEADIMC